ncbi:hypothetical protein [Brevibacillus brevis]|uniref:hypothetical protein n=1 Tax=Brevibacillus brevis TaxID=1393 RepID=UPI001EDA521F|nr:hypothetical protein [Brevibacillus brevis]
MINQPFTSKPHHQHILKETQLVDAFHTLMTQVSHPQQAYYAFRRGYPTYRRQ